MLKHHKLISFCIGLAFLIIMQKFATPEPVFRFLLPAFLFYSGAVALYDRWYLRQIQEYNIWTLIRMTLLLAAAFGLFLAMPTEFLRGLFLISSVILMTFFQMIIGKQAENILLNETLIIAFGMFFGLLAAYFYFPSFQPLYMAAIFTGTALLARSFYEATPMSSKGKVVASMVIGLFCSQAYWALNFLQPHYSALAVILFNVFYFCLILNYYHVFHNLNYKKIQFHLLFMAACLVIVLFSTRWTIILT